MTGLLQFKDELNNLLDGIPPDIVAAVAALIKKFEALKTSAKDGADLGGVKTGIASGCSCKTLLRMWMTTRISNNIPVDQMTAIFGVPKLMDKPRRLPPASQGPVRLPNPTVCGPIRP